MGRSFDDDDVVVVAGLECGNTVVEGVGEPGRGMSAAEIRQECCWECGEKGSWDGYR